jgi:hypothetical protein
MPGRDQIQKRLKAKLGHRAILMKLQASATANMTGDWAQLKYPPPLTAARVAEFCRRLAATGNSMPCEQTSIDGLAASISQWPTYESFAAAHPETIRDACGPAFAYLYEAIGDRWTVKPFIPGGGGGLIEADQAS